MQTSQITAEIIVADAEPTIRDKITTVLRMNGYNVTVAERGFQLLAMVEEKKYNLVILNSELPDMSAFEAVTLIRTNFTSYELPIFLLISSKDKEWNQKIIDEGVNDFETRKNENVPKITAKIKALIDLFKK